MKWKNYGLWMSIASLLYMVFKDLGYQIDLTQWETYVTGILSILVALGIISNPENGKGFFNSKVPPTQSGNTPNNPTNRINELDSFPNQVESQVQNILDHSNQIVDSSTTQTTEEIVPDRRFTPNEK